MAREPYEVLIIGAGSIGERHIRCFLATGRTDVSFVEPQPALREQVAARYPNATAYADTSVAPSTSRAERA